MKFKDTKIGIVPSHWEVQPIKKITEIVTDYVANGSFASLAENVTYKDEEDVAVLIRLVDYNNGFQGKFVFIDEHAYQFLGKSKLFGGEIIISNVGANVGTVFRCPQLAYKMSLAPNSVMVKFKGNDDFYFHWLRGFNGQQMLKSIVTGSAQPKFNKTNFKEMLAPVPPIGEQNKIASILNTIDEKIEINKKINNNLEQQTQAIFKSWFVDFELNYGIMPSDWKVSQLGSIAKISTEVFSPAKNPNVEVEHYSIPAYDEKRYPVFETSNGIKSNKYRLSSNSVMISKLNPDTKRIWRPYCISDNPICSTEFIVYEPINPLNRDFIYSIIDSIGFSAFLCSHTTGSTNSRQRATPSITLTYDIIVPDEKTIQAFCSIVSPMYDTIENNIKENQKLAETRDKLLPKLMSGELDVSNIEL